jgi:hypothetical protein
MVERTSALSIWPVLLEVAAVNIIMGIAMCALPKAALINHTEDMVKVLAHNYVGGVFAKGSSVVFALLLFSAGKHGDRGDHERALPDGEVGGLP